MRGWIGDPPLEENRTGNIPRGKCKLIDRMGMDAVLRITSPKSEKHWYLTGYDTNEDPPLYFLARLPHKVTSVKEAIEALKPESVKEAERLGLSILRQGDMFAIPTPTRQQI